MEIQFVQVEVHDGIHEVYVAVENHESQPQWDKYIGHLISVNDLQFGMVFFPEFIKVVEIESGYVMMDLPVDQEEMESYSELQAKKFFGEVVGPTLHLTIEQNGREEFMEQKKEALAYITAKAGPKPESREVTLEEAKRMVADQEQ